MTNAGERHSLNERRKMRAIGSDMKEILFQIVKLNNRFDRRDGEGTFVNPDAR